MAKTKTTYKSRLLAEAELLPDELLREIIDFAAFLKQRYNNELEVDATAIKQRYEQGKREKAKGRTTPTEEIFAEAQQGHLPKSAMTASQARKLLRGSAQGENLLDALLRSRREDLQIEEAKG